MGHLVGKDIYRSLGKKIDNLTVRAPWNDTLRALLAELYTPQEADLVVRMPYGLSDLQRLQRVTGIEERVLAPLLETLCDKGLVMDLEAHGSMHYIPSPMIIGIFEFSMMRTGRSNLKKIAPLFSDYLLENPAFLAANFEDRQQVSVMRTVAHGEAITEDHVEILDFERAEELIAQADTFAVGICSCRHEKMHLGWPNCRVPLETCTSFGFGAKFLVRHGLARAISREEMRQIFVRSRDQGLVLCADNVQRKATFVCHCCGCCCNAMLGISRHGYENSVVSSSFIASIAAEKCTGCGRCATACPIGAIAIPVSQGHRVPSIDTERCLGCGVCALACKTVACGLVKCGRRVITPETNFEKIILQCLERGTLQNQLFDEPSRLSHRFLRGVIGGFLKLPPVKRALMGETLRSRFLSAMKAGAVREGKGWATEL